MSDLTPREVRIARGAYKLGRRDELLYPGPEAGWDAAAAGRYPLPTVEVPRIATVGGCDYRVVEGVLQFRFTGDSDSEWATDPVIIARTHVINDLLHRSTERKEVTE